MTVQLPAPRRARAAAGAVHVHVGRPIRATVSQDPPRSPVAATWRPSSTPGERPGPVVKMTHRPGRFVALVAATLVLFGWVGFLAGHLLGLPPYAIVGLGALAMLAGGGWLLLLRASVRGRVGRWAVRLAAVALVAVVAGGGVWLALPWLGR